MPDKIKVRMLEEGHGICRGFDKDSEREIVCDLDETIEIAEDTAETLISTGLVERTDDKREKNRTRIRVVDSGYGIGKKNQVRSVPKNAAERWYLRGIAVREQDSLLPLVRVEVLEDDPKLGSRGRRFRTPAASAKFLESQLLVKILKVDQPAAV